ncbi:hypothetical protein EKH79_00400 [Dyella dinghuensis]|uniref:Uncharacterized protein n=1 Tax=Dyella dinghuensis TaxID=1920169 RepID=A0A3S0PEP7_9GAMM|nr:hypothetical protein [Dyella dinghuensis]RUL67101.1 hypothetical protein EKH79_00400 [Dyella dinghuensis]
MKAWQLIWIASIAALSLGACHRGPTALSADGETLREGQTVYLKDGGLACFSEGEWREAQEMIQGGGMPALLEYTKGGAHCGMLEKGESVKILTVEPDDGHQLVVVHDQDDPSAPAQLWMESKRLTLNKP